MEAFGKMFFLERASCKRFNYKENIISYKMDQYLLSKKKIKINLIKFATKQNCGVLCGFVLTKLRVFSFKYQKL